MTVFAKFFNLISKAKADKRGITTVKLLRDAMKDGLLCHKTTKVLIFELKSNDAFSLPQ